MNNGDNYWPENGQYGEAPYNEEEYYEEQPADGYPSDDYTEYAHQKPPKKKKGLLIGIISAVVAAIIIIAVVFLFFNPLQSPIVGTWHITQTKVTDSHGNTTASQGEAYIVFNASGTGYSVSKDEYSISSDNFTWKDVGGGKISLSPSTGSEEHSSLSLLITYSIQGDKITLEYTVMGNKITMYGERVNSIPSSFYSNPQNQQLVASLSYMAMTSNPEGGWANFSLSLSNPESIEPGDVQITVNGHTLSYFNDISYIGQWSYIDINGDGKITDGDIIEIHDNNLAGAEVSLSVSGYSGSIAVEIPSS